MDAEDLLLRQFLGIQDERTTEAAARFIRGEQRDGRHLGHLPRRARRTLHHHRGVRRAAAGRRPARRAAHGAGRPPGSASRAASPPAGSSPGSGWRSSAGGSGTTCPNCRPSSSSSRSGSRSTSTTSAAGRGRPSCRSPSSRRSARCARRPSRSTSCTPTRARPNPPQAACARGELGRRSSSASTRRCTPTARSAPRRLRRAAHEQRRPLDHRAPGERRLLGRHPAARRVLA